MTVWANTWGAIIDVTLDADGEYHICIGPYGSRNGRLKVFSGNAHEDIKVPPPPKPRQVRVRWPRPEPVCVME